MSSAFRHETAVAKKIQPAADSFFSHRFVNPSSVLSIPSVPRLFVWDKPKNEANKQIHGIDFYTAIYVFNDDDRLEDDNQVVDGELREQAIGEPEEPIVEGHPINTKHSRPKAIIGEVEGVLFVVFTMEEGPDWKATRIISARAADEDEVKAYFDWKYGS